MAHLASAWRLNLPQVRRYHGTVIDVFGAPFDLNGFQPGSSMGPAALRLAGLVEALAEVGQSARDRGDVPVGGPATAPGGMRNFAPMLDLAVALRGEVARALAEGRTPLVVGGDHTVVVGGIAAALDAFAGDLALLWIDAHGDVNTPGTSDTGNVHGMPVAALQGLPSGVEGAEDFEWRQLLRALGEHRLRPGRTAWFGLRDVDAGERPRIREGLGLTMSDVDRRGVDECVARIDAFLRAGGARHLWISFDVDALDPVLAPGTGTAVRGGLSYREAHLLAELLYERMADVGCPYRLVGLDIVETNPLVDTGNATARMAVEWTRSLFGKAIL